MAEMQPAQQQWPVTFGDGATALAIAYEPDKLALTLLCDRAHPPGRPLAMRAHVAGEELALQGKSAGSKRREDGRFIVRIRLVTLRREQRAALERALPTPSAL